MAVGCAANAGAVHATEAGGVDLEVYRWPCEYTTGYEYSKVDDDGSCSGMAHP